MCLAEFMTDLSPTGSKAVLRSKLVDGRCQVQLPVALVDRAVRSFLRNSSKYGIEFLRKTATDGTALPAQVPQAENKP